MSNILVIDDEYSILESIDMFLGEKGHTVYKASTGEEGLSLFFKYEPEIVILDIRLPDQNGLDILSVIQENGIPAKVIMITAFQDMDTTIEAMKRGAYDYIHKPLDADDVEKAVNRALSILALDRETPMPSGPDKPLRSEVIVGRSEKMRETFKMIGLLCQHRATVLIQGETGTGKELVARMIHRNSIYSQEPFFTLDCSSVVETLLESELFGHEKGAFTGAIHSKPGKIELAGNGTLFLDEVGELPLNLQGKFLGFLQRHEYMRVGGQQILQARCRIITATNRDLAEQVKKGKFREDLFFRLKVVNIHLPPLRDRLTDIPDLVNHFLQKINLELGTDVSRLQHGVIERLMEHHWSGNVRELENVLVEAVVRARSKVILLEEVEDILSSNDNDIPGGFSSYSLPEIEKEHIRNTLLSVGGNRSKTAHILGVSLPTLRSKIKKYDIVLPEKGPL